MTDAAIRADYATYRPVPSRKVLQIVLEVPLEEQAHVFGVLGYPTAGQSKWVGVALLNGQSSVPSCAVSPSGKDEGSDSPATPKKRFSELPRSQQAAIKLTDPSFNSWVRKVAAGYRSVGIEWGADEYLKARLRITSKRELDTDPEAAKRWDALLTDFDMRDFRS